jgi:hypothetical protein
MLFLLLTFLHVISLHGVEADLQIRYPERKTTTYEYDLTPLIEATHPKIVSMEVGALKDVNTVLSTIVEDSTNTSFDWKESILYYKRPFVKEQIEYGIGDLSILNQAVKTHFGTPDQLFFNPKMPKVLFSIFIATSAIAACLVKSEMKFALISAGVIYGIGMMYSLYWIKKMNDHSAEKDSEYKRYMRLSDDFKKKVLLEKAPDEQSEAKKAE